MKKPIWISIIISLALILITIIDIIVLEQIYHHIANTAQISWEVFSVNFLGGKILAWYLAFIPLILGTFILLALATKEWKYLTGIIITMTGWEDILYYVFQLKQIPATLPWLNNAPLISWSRIFTQTLDVTIISLFISAIAGLGIVIAIFNHKKITNLLKKSN